MWLLVLRMPLLTGFLRAYIFLSETDRKRDFAETHLLKAFMAAEAVSHAQIFSQNVI